LWKVAARQALLQGHAMVSGWFCNRSPVVVVISREAGSAAFACEDLRHLGEYDDREDHAFPRIFSSTAARRGPACRGACSSGTTTRCRRSPSQGEQSRGSWASKRAMHTEESARPQKRRGCPIRSGWRTLRAGGRRPFRPAGRPEVVDHICEALGRRLAVATVSWKHPGCPSLPRREERSSGLRPAPGRAMCLGQTTGVRVS